MFLITNLYRSPFYKIIVPTIDTVRYEYIVTSLLGGEYPVLLVGNVGTGKTSTAISVTESKDKAKYSVLNINISAQVSTSLGIRNSLIGGFNISIFCFRLIYPTFYL